MSWTNMAARQPEWIDAAPIRVEATRTIGAPPDRVWDVIADHQGWPQWFPAVRRVEVTGTGTGVGGSRRVTISGGARFDEDFTAWEPGDHFAFTVVGMRPPLMRSLAESVRLESDGTGTVVSYRQGFEPRRAVTWVWQQARSRIQSQLEEGLAGLAARAEHT
jgi:uncharacterized protein YndB with AHSA1/START domain